MPRKRRSTKSAAPRDIATPATPDFGYRHDVETRQDRAGGVQGWRVRTRLDGLFADELIDAAEWQAGDDYRRHVEVGEHGGRIAAVGDHGGGGTGCPTVSRLAALQKLGLARQQLTVVQRLAMDGLAADLSWPALGEKLGRGRDAARSEAIAALRVLAEHYQLRSKVGRIRAVEIV